MDSRANCTLVALDVDRLADEVCRRIEDFGIMGDRMAVLDFICCVLELNAWVAPRDRIKQIKSIGRMTINHNITADETLSLYEYVGKELTRVFSVVTVISIDEISHTDSDFYIKGSFINEI